MRIHPHAPPPANHVIETTPYLPATPGPYTFTHGREEMETVLLGKKIRTDDGRAVTMLHPYGRGGFGDIWIATLEGRSSSVVVKFARDFPDDPDRSQLSQQRLAAESAMLKSLCCDGIPALLGEGRAFLLIEHIHGKTWREILDRIDPTRAPGEFLRRPAELACLLSHLHGRGIVHGDVKPENILSGTPAGSPHAPRTWLIDFGLAFRLHGGDELVQAGLTVGTRGYIDPCLIGRAHERSFATDIYALGAMLFEGYTRMPLFTKTEWNEAILLRNEVEYARMSEREFIHWYETLIREKTDSFPITSERYAAVEELIMDILRPDTSSHARPEASRVAERLLRIAETI